MSDAYTIETRERGKRLDVRPIADPFVNHTIRPRGWRTALAVLRWRYSLTIVVSAPHDLVEKVLELDDDYLGEQGSERRNAWNAQLEGALHDFAAQAGEHADD